MSGKQQKSDDGQFEQLPAAAWFAAMFGQCWKEPSTEDDLKFDDLDKKEKKSKKTDGSKKSRRSPSAADSGQGGSRRVAEQVDGSVSRAAEKESVGASRYMVDNSVLQIKSHPGVAFRYSKLETDKVKSGPGPAKWGEIVEGIDEGDGWLKVGNFYLPMVYQGVPIVTPVADSESKSVEGVAQAPATPLTKPVQNASPLHDSNAENTEVGAPQDHAESKLPDAVSPEKVAQRSNDVENSKFVEEGAPTTAGDAPLPDAAVTCTGTVVVDEPAKECLASDEQEKVGAGFDTPESIGTAVKMNADSSELKCNDVNVTKDISKDCCEVASARRPWFVQPSVGTWLRILPETEDSSNCLCVAEPEIKPCHVEWHHLPSVGTWLHKKPAWASVEVVAVPVVFEQPESTKVEASCDDKVVHQCEQVSEPVQDTDNILQ